MRSSVVLICALLAFLALSPVFVAVAPAETAEHSEPSLEQRFLELSAAYDELRDAEPGSRTLAIAGMIASVIWLAVSLLKRFFANKSWLPWVALSAGVVTGFLSEYVMGVGVVSAVIYGAAGPAAVLVQELMQVITKRQAA
jgi:hypothetical protein